MSSALPIGIFDSGIGGLTLANAIRKILPNEQLIYFGDTAHMPYGDKSPEAIKFYSLKIAKFLLDKNNYYKGGKLTFEGKKLIRDYIF